MNILVAIFAYCCFQPRSKKKKQVLIVALVLREEVQAHIKNASCSRMQPEP